MRYKCKLCGYIAGDEEYNEEGYVCPICGVDKHNFEVYEEEVPEDKRVRIDPDNPSINRVMEKCINCGVCKKVCKSKVGIEYDYSKCDKALCVNCGTCILNCPTGALTPKYDYMSVFNEISNPEKTVVVFTAPAVRVGLGECFGLESGENVQGKMVKSLRELGFDYVLDTTFGADVTIIEEIDELIERINNNGVLPMFTSCCPSWVKYVEMFNQDFVSNLSTTKSPNAIMGALVKSYFAKEKGINPKNVVTVGIVPCTSKKYEAARENLVNDGMKNVDYMLTTTELALMIREKKIDFKSLEEDYYDELMGTGSSAGLIFGSSGGVMEAALRTLNYKLSGNNLDSEEININSVRGNDFLREASFKINDKSFNVAVVYGLINAEKLLDKIRKGEAHYHFVEVMSCDNGCVGGAGQVLITINRLEEARNARFSNLFSVDNMSNVRFAHENKEVKKFYEEFLRENNSKVLHEILHTEYKIFSEVSI